MKEKWKYDNRITLSGEIAAMLFIAVLLISSCNSNEKHKHIADKSVINLDGLVQPVNQTVFSSVKTISPQKQSVTPMLNASGIITYNPQLVNNISARFNGRIEKLYVRFNFQQVNKGQRIMDIYSPEILTEQQNLLFLLNNSATDISLIQSSKQKLELLGLTAEQISLIETNKQIINPLPVYSPYTGHIHDIGISNGSSSSNSSMNSSMSNSSPTSSTQIQNIPSSQSSSLSIKEGMYLQSGQPVFAVYNISQVWALLNIFQKDALFVKVGDMVSITSETNSNDTVYAHINYIEPVTGQNTSAITARVYLNNSKNLHLKIGILVSAEIMSSEITGIWLPRNAIVNIGMKQIVFLKSEGHFIAKEIQTGFMSDSLVEIISGLNGSEELAENAQYLVDSESFIKRAINE